MVAFQAALAPGVAAQESSAEIRCLAPLVTTPLGQQPGEVCSVEPIRAGHMQRAQIRLEVVEQGNKAVPKLPLRFRVSSGTMVGDTITNTQGQVDVVWFRVVSADSVGTIARISVEGVTTAGRPVVQYIEIRPSTIELATRLAQSFPGAGFVNSSLSRPMIVEIKKIDNGQLLPIEDPEICRAQRITFRREAAAGTMTPDTASGTVYAARDRGSIFGNAAPYEKGCFAAAGWQVGPSTGVQRARAVLLPGAGFRTSAVPIQARTVVRPTPRFIIGAVARHDESYLGRHEGTPRVYRVERILPSGEKALFDSVATPISVDSVDNGSFAAMAGVSLPIPIYGGSGASGYVLNRLTVTVGVNPERPMQDQYVGISVLHFLPRIPETFPLQLDLLGHFGERDELVSPGNCENKLGADPCETEAHHQFRGVAASLSFDASALIADVIKKLGK